MPSHRPSRRPSHPRTRLLALPLLASLAPGAPALAAGPGAGEPPEEKAATMAPAPARERTVLSSVYTVDRKYRSMQGPSSRQDVLLGGEEGEPELVWITGYEAVMVGADGETPELQEFMCHSNLDLNVRAHRERLPVSPSFNSRLFTLSQGQLEIHFPEGFGIPVMSDEALGLTTQVLNHNLEGEERQVRHRVTLHYVRDAGLEEPMTPLFPVSAYGLAALDPEPGYFGIEDAKPEMHGPGCLPGENASGHVYEDHLGQDFTGHWVVPPGRQVNRTLVTRLMRIPYETTLHYVAVHVHPFARSLELRDLTTGEVLFASDVENFGDRVGLERVEYFSSVEGVPVYPDHDYELVSVYENTSDVDQDSMAVMYMYLRDKRLEERLTAGYDPARVSPGDTNGDRTGDTGGE